MKQLSILVFLSLLFLNISCYKEKDYLPSNIDNSGFLKLSASSTMLPADGETSIYIIAELPIDVKEDKTTITFNTTKGSFENGQKSMTKNATIQAIGGLNQRIARVKLISGTSISQAIVEASIGDITQSITINFVNINYDLLLTLTSTLDSIPADGESYSLITVEQPLDIKDEFQNITFTTTKGSFENGQKSINKISVVNLENNVYKRKAEVRLISSKHSETAEVEVSIKGTSKKITLNFVKALPDSIRLLTSALSLSPGFNNVITLTTNLIRKIGTPSAGNNFTIDAYDIGGNRLGYFVNLTTVSDESAIVVNKFTLGDQNYHGPLKIIASTLDANNLFLRDSVQIISQ